MPQEKPRSKLDAMYRSVRGIRHGGGSWSENLEAETTAIRHKHIDNSVRTIKEFRKNRGRAELFSQRDPGLNEFGLMDAYPPTPPTNPAPEKRKIRGKVRKSP